MEHKRNARCSHNRHFHSFSVALELFFFLNISCLMYSVNCPPSYLITPQAFYNAPVEIWHC